MSSFTLQCNLDLGIAKHYAPGATMLVHQLGNDPIMLASGSFTYDYDSTTVDIYSLFDLASITKCVGTTTIVMWLYDKGLLDLDKPLVDYFPEFGQAHPEQKSWRSKVTIRHLLAHCSGLPPFLKFYATHAHLTDWHQRRSLILSTQLVTEPGTKEAYSDIGFMILGELIRELTGRRIDDVARDIFVRQLLMVQTFYNLLPAGWNHCVPTEMKADDEKSYWQGIVHDENARWLEGAAGHAGLFSSIVDLDKYGKAMLTGDAGLFSQKTIDLFTQRANIVPGSSRCLGWDSPEQPSSGGKYVSPTAFGHTGFTGTSFWMDPEYGMIVALLTNAVHPKRECKNNGYFPWRNDMHSLAYKTILNLG